MEQRTYPSDGATHADHMSWHQVVPWLKILLIVAILVAIVTVIAVASERYSNSIYQEQVTVPAQASVLEPERVPAPVVVVAKEWPKVEVVWREVPPTPGVYLLNPIQGDGFYTGTMNTPNGGVATLEGLAFIATILPQLKEGGMVAAARDSVDKDVVFVSITSHNSRVYLFLSVDGEKSWHELNLAPVDAPASGSHAVRVHVDNGSIRLVARDNVVGEKWWEATVKR